MEMQIQIKGKIKRPRGAQLLKRKEGSEFTISRSQLELLFLLSFPGPTKAGQIRLQLHAQRKRKEGCVIKKLTKKKKEKRGGCGINKEN
jgi:hypothetical protein